MAFILLASMGTLQDAAVAQHLTDHYDSHVQLASALLLNASSLYESSSVAASICKLAASAIGSLEPYTSNFAWRSMARLVATPRYGVAHALPSHHPRGEGISSERLPLYCSHCFDGGGSCYASYKKPHVTVVLRATVVLAICSLRAVSCRALPCILAMQPTLLITLAPSLTPSVTIHLSTVCLTS